MIKLPLRNDFIVVMAGITDWIIEDLARISSEMYPHKI